MPLENTFTVVIFSSPVDVELNKFPQLSIKNIGPRKKAQAGDEIIKTIYEIFKNHMKEYEEKKLRIICIDALDLKGELSGENAEGILKSLKSSLTSQNKSPFHVIILPKFYLHTGKEAREIMESLWYLREHVVLISSSSLHATLLPSTEVIAVGAATELQTVRSKSSVLDFLVTNRETGPTSGTSSDKEPLLHDWIDQDLIRPLGPAVVSVIALSILDCLSNTSLSGK